MPRTMVGAVVLLALLGYTCIQAAPTADEVTDLPGLTWQLGFRHYSGYLTATGTRHLHYWFVEASDINPTSAPVVLWLNGGPGCSSLEGMLQENGPFRVADDGVTLTKNKYSWNKIANMLYLEAPAGVGYSYSDDKNYTTSDDQTAIDNHAALLSFFKKFPEYANNDFYVTGESYAGIYIPTLAMRIYEDTRIQFKGFAIGNALSDLSHACNSDLYYAYYHGMFSQKLWLNAVAACCKDGNSTIGNCDFCATAAACRDSVRQIKIAYADIYNIYNDCPSNPIPPKSTAVDYAKMSVKDKWLHRVSEAMQCMNFTALISYLTNSAVMQALHIPANLPAWTVCNERFFYHEQYSSMHDQYIKLLSTGRYRILLYNGDFDYLCNFLGEQWFVDGLHQELILPEKSWTYVNDEGTELIGGHVMQYRNITFTTVRGAGHMVPNDKPLPALIIFKNFITGTPF